MNRSALPLALLFLLGSCGEEGTVSAQDLLGKAGELVKDIDLSAPVTVLKEQGGKVVGYVTEQLGNVKDSATAEKVAKALEPILDSAGGLLKKLGDELPSRGELKDAVENAQKKFEKNDGVMKHLGPVLEKLSGFLGESPGQ